MGKSRKGCFIPGENFTASDLFGSICETLIESGQLVIEKKDGKYRWEIKEKHSKVVVKASKGDTLKIAICGEE